MTKESKEKKTADKAPKQEHKFPLILKGKTPAELAEHLKSGCYIVVKRTRSWRDWN